MRLSLSDYALGAAAATDLVNTSPTVRGDAGDALADEHALVAFLTDHHLQLDATKAHSTTVDDLSQVHLLRREVRGIIETATEVQAVAGATVLVKRAGAAPTLYRDAAGRWEWCLSSAPDATLADELATFVGAGLLAVIRALGHERFRPCAAPDCRGVFIDTSRAGRRRYCMPDRCGNRLNVANYRARQQEGNVTR